MEQSARPSLDQREARIGELRVLYCAARRRGGEWFALGDVIDDRAARRMARLVSGRGPTEYTAIEAMLHRVAERAHAAVEPR